MHLGAPIYVAESVLERSDGLAYRERSEADHVREAGADAGAIVRETQERLAREAEHFKGRAA